MQLSILGPFELNRDGVAVTLGRAERALLIRLALSANQVVSRDRLIDDLWEGAPPGGAGATLRVYLSRLRKALGMGSVVTREPGYVLVLTGDELDVAHFERLLSEGRELVGRGAPNEASSVLSEALGVWRGPALADVADRGFALGEAARLEEARLTALECRIEADLACGRHDDLVGELESLTMAYPLQERLWAYRMLSLYRSGRQAEALRVYQKVRRLLADDLGIDPGPDLRQLEDAILRQAPELAAPPTLTMGHQPDRATTSTSRAITGRPRVLIVDDHPLWRETLCAVLVESAEVVGEAADGLEAVRIAGETTPDVVLMDIAVPEMDGIEATRRIIAAGSGTRVLVLSSSDDRVHVLGALRAGASGYLVKTAGGREISEAIVRIHAGELVFPPRLASVVLDEFRRAP